MITKELTIGDCNASDTKGEEHWFAFVVRPRSEKFVAKLLQQMGYTHFVPLVEDVKIYSRKIRKVQKTIIPGYVFVKISPMSIVPVLMIEGVYNVIKFEGKPAVVKQREIELLQLMTGGDFSIELVKERPELGDTVRIVQGRLNGVVGKLIKKERKNRIIIEMSSVDISLAISVPVESVIKI